MYELCALKYPYEATEIEELEFKVLNKKYNPIPYNVINAFKQIIKKCLKKKPESRPTIEDIIFDENFQ